MRIAIDVMGGDNAPDAILNGCLDARQLLEPNDTLVLVGDERIIREGIEERGIRELVHIEIEPTTQVIAMSDKPVSALRDKPDSSIARLAWLGGKRAGDKRCDVVISAGNTGACVAAASMSMRRLRGVHRPGVCVTMPTFHGPVVLCDVGANPDPRPTHLHQYATMATVFAERVTEKVNPRVALLNVGDEETKGSQLVLDTHTLLKNDPNVNYVGYAEGRDIFEGKADVIVCEGFTGNVVLKLAEAMASGLFRMIAHEIFATDPELALKFEPVVKSIYAKHDYHEYGGAPLLGANGVLLICHGSSEARTIVSTVRQAKQYLALKVNDGLLEALAEAQDHLQHAKEGSA